MLIFSALLFEEVHIYGSNMALNFENIVDSMHYEILQPMVNDDCGGVCQGGP